MVGCRFCLIMRATDYKRQFVEFLIKAWPTGLPEGMNGVKVYANDTEYEFKVDSADYRTHIEAIEKKKTKGINSEADKLVLTKTDLAWLKGLYITVPADGEDE